MKYLCLVYQEEKQEANVPREQIEQAKQDYWAFAEDIKKSGHLIGSNGLKHTDAATTVRVRNGKVSTTDGTMPFRWPRGFRPPSGAPSRFALSGANNYPPGGSHEIPVHDLLR